MEVDRSDEIHQRAKLKNTIEKLSADIQALENNLRSGNPLPRVPRDFLSAIDVKVPRPTDTDDLKQSINTTSELSRLVELSAKVSGFKIGKVSRKLCFSRDEPYVYECLMEGGTSSIKFRMTFCETIKGPADKCGEITDMKADVIMTKGDPESLSDWIGTCCLSNDIPVLISGLVKFSELADNRRCILRSLYRRGKAGEFGLSTFWVNGEGDGVTVVGIGPDKTNLFSINWKIQYCHAMKCMRPTFQIQVHDQDVQVESAEIFAALERPFLSDDDLPQLWDTIADTLASCV